MRWSGEYTRWLVRDRTLIKQRNCESGVFSDGTIQLLLLLLLLLLHVRPSVCHADKWLGAGRILITLVTRNSPVSKLVFYTYTSISLIPTLVPVSLSIIICYIYPSIAVVAPGPRVFACWYPVCRFSILLLSRFSSSRVSAVFARVFYSCHRSIARSLDRSTIFRILLILRGAILI